MKTSNATSSATASSQCPYHPEPYLRFVTKWKSLLAIGKSIGDTVYYCAGDGGRCSWVYSEKVGGLVLPGLDRLSPLDVKRAYQRAIAERVQAEGEKKDYGHAPWES